MKHGLDPIQRMLSRKEPLQTKPEVHQNPTQLRLMDNTWIRRVAYLFYNEHSHV